MARVISFTISRSGLVLNAVLSRKASKMRLVPAKNLAQPLLLPSRFDRLPIIKKAAAPTAPSPGT